MRRISGHGASLISISLVLLAVGCGGGGSSSQSAAVLNLAGTWQASTNSKLGFNTFLAGTLTQTGTQISGTLTIGDSPCATSGTLSGSVSGSTVTLSLMEGSQSVSLTGTVTPDGNSITGTYQAQSGGCTNGDSGTFTATRVTSTVLNLAGNWEASTDSVLGFSTFLSGTFTQTGNQISGTMSISGSPCAVSGILSGTVTGTSVTLTLIEGLQSVSLIGTAAPDGNSITGTYQAPAGGCLNGDSGTFTATRITSNAGCAPVPTGIVSWWRGEDNAQDATGANPGVLQGGVTFGPGEVGQAFYLDGSTGYVYVPDSASLDSITTTQSVELWANPKQIPVGVAAYFYAHRDPGIQESFNILEGGDGTLAVTVGTTSGTSVFFSQPGVIQFGQFQHIAATANTNTSTLVVYLNGAEVPMHIQIGPSTFSGTFAVVHNLFLGEWGASSQFFPGVLDEISLYSTVLSQSQIQTIVNAGSAGKCH